MTSIDEYPCGCVKKRWGWFERYLVRCGNRHPDWVIRSAQARPTIRQPDAARVAKEIYESGESMRDVKITRVR